MNKPKGAVSAARDDLRALPAEALITVGGMVTTAAVVGVNLLVANYGGFNFLSLSFWFVIPAGAIIGGMGAASGYYATARITQTMPSRTLLINMVVVAMSAWFLSKWASYATLVLEDGTRVADLISFWQYFVITTESTQLSFGTRGRMTGSTGELGMLGYVREALQLVGFMVGGFASYMYLTDVEACESCKCYAKTETILSCVSPERFDDALEETEISLPNLGGVARLALGNGALEGLSLVLARCPRCNQEWLRPALVTRSGDSFETTKLTRYNVDAEISNDVRNLKANWNSKVKADPTG
jgi:hypothetical protein